MYMCYLIQQTFSVKFAEEFGKFIYNGTCLLSLIIVLLIIQINNHVKKLRAFLLEYTDNVKLFDICSKYCSLLMGESSVKVKADGTIAKNRYTIPYHINKMPDTTIRVIFEEMAASDREILQVLEFIATYKTSDSDILLEPTMG